jgi:hypothetical protein
MTGNGNETETAKRIDKEISEIRRDKRSYATLVYQYGQTVAVSLGNSSCLTSMTASGIRKGILPHILLQGQAVEWRRSQLKLLQLLPGGPKREKRPRKRLARQARTGEEVRIFVGSMTMT